MSSSTFTVQLIRASNTFGFTAYALAYDEKPVAWIGLNDVVENGQWNWLDNNPTTFKRWARGEQLLLFRTF